MFSTLINVELYNTINVHLAFKLLQKMHMQEQILDISILPLFDLTNNLFVSEKFPDTSFGMISVFLFLPEQVIQAAHGLFLHRGKDVRVNAERDADMAMTQ